MLKAQVPWECWGCRSVKMRIQKGVPGVRALPCSIVGTVQLNIWKNTHVPQRTSPEGEVELV